MAKTSKSEPAAKNEPAPDVDPFDAAQAKTLLTSVSVLRDPVHGDIRVTALERCLIDTPEFQRLRHVNQLAMVDLVYPGAVHNRFLHSLGTLHVCSEMVLASNNAVKMYPPLAGADHPVPVKIGPYAELLARLVALLHDTAHVPFGHVFEKEAKTFAHDEWADPWRVEQVFGATSRIRAEAERFVKHELDLSPQTAAEKTDALLKEVIAVLCADDDSINNLRYPFAHDLVGNTICADLIDYIQRDMYFSGLTEGLALRFLQYLAVIPVEVIKREDRVQLRPCRVSDVAAPAAPRFVLDGSTRICRLAMLQYRYNKQREPVVKHSILAEAIDLVRRRKTISEKLYFHKTKLVATSMLSAAAHAASITTAEPIWLLSDLEVLKLIAAKASTPTPSAVAIQSGPAKTAITGMDLPQSERRTLRASVIANKLLKRSLFKPIYRVSHHPDSGDAAGNRLWDERTGVYSRYCSPTGKEKLIEMIEMAICLNTEDVPNYAVGTVSVSCPDKRMQLKEFEMLVLARPSEVELRPLKKTVAPIVKQEIQIIQDGHKELWCFEVCVDAHVVKLNEEFVRMLAGAIQEEVGIPNEIDAFANQKAIRLADLHNELFVKYVIDHYLAEPGAVTHEHFVAARDTIAALPGLEAVEQLRSHFSSLRYGMK